VLYPQKFVLVLISVRSWVNLRATIWLEGSDKVTSFGIELANFWLVA
jgi:hypothetical protein